MAILALEKKPLEVFFNTHLWAQEIMFTEPKQTWQSEPAVTEEIVSLKMRQFLSLLRKDLGQKFNHFNFAT